MSLLFPLRSGSVFKKTLAGTSVAALMALASCAEKDLHIGSMPKEDLCIAVLPFEVRYDAATTNELLSEFIALDLYRNGARGIVGPRDVDQLFRTAGEPLPPTIDPYWAAEIGRKLKVDGVIFGALSRIPIWRGTKADKDELQMNIDSYYLDAKTGEIRWVYGAKEVTPGDHFVARLGQHSDMMVKSLLSQHSDRSEFGKPDCWAKPEPKPLAVAPTPTPVPSLTENQKRILKELTAPNGLLIKAEAFSERSEQLSKEAVSILRDVGAALKSPEAPTNVRIAAHVDGTEDSASDLRLSKNRAEAIKDYLEKLGVEDRRMKAVGFGSTKPIVPNINRRSRMMNRRVELTVLPATETP
ncbi:MAG TPA: OmpA family protein [Bdellovibrionota bacterium]|nr:OmpA family protein [Bdellovibrionota bacterium]